MIFGSADFQKELFENIKEIETREKLTVLYIGTVGSISCGLSDINSDYDVKCLFIRNETFINKSEQHDESKIRLRRFDSEKVYECIAFWEITAFVNFLAEPFIDSGNKYNLWRNVMWLFMTPYAWDPLGLKGKISHDLLSCMNLQNELLYHYNLIDKLINNKINEKVLSAREVSRLLHAFFSIKWIKEKNELPPLNILSLLSITPDQKVRNFYVENLINDYKHMDKDEILDVEKKWKKSEGYAHLMGRVFHMYEKMKPGYADMDYDFSSLTSNKKFVDNILHTIHWSYKKIPYVENVGLKDYQDVSLRNY
ncbi:DNA polymerase beta superfamily protein [Luxibacter massiliensis]|uniref:DNA polymerase beta superfamily protein n=1 Tax=Luxibacter massiliensis TaxID=2219695 RepID=UPI000F04A2B3|nr:nucleotidyltransferase domain-containing protein [Luxibacter massiliensis]